MEQEKVLSFEFQNAWDYENGFYLTSPLPRLAKSIAHYEIYKKIINLPGEVIECGVYKGASIVRFATYREMIESQYSRKIIGFDAFGAFPQVSSGGGQDEKFIADFQNAGGDGISQEDMEYVFKRKGITNYELIKGDIRETLPAYVKKRPELRIALLHIDVDVYDPTMVVLETLFDHIVPCGIIVLDDYATVYGATRAVDKFFSERAGHSLYLEKLPFYKVPAFIVKK